jgi:hypothetical protein
MSQDKGFVGGNRGHGTIRGRVNGKQRQQENENIVLFQILFITRLMWGWEK